MQIFEKSLKICMQYFGCMGLIRIDFKLNFIANSVKMAM